MTSYVFDLIRTDGTIESFDLGAFETDVDALQYAGRALAGSPSAFAVNVWCDGVRVGRLRRDVPAPVAQSAPREPVAA